MKTVFSFLFLIFLSLASFAQSKFDKTLGEISSDLAVKLTKKEKKKVVVLYITDINKATTTAGKYLADVISVNIVNDTSNFQVFDRENLSGIAEANKLIAEGYIDVDKTKELGKLLSVEAIITGNYTVLDSTIKLTLKALDSGTGFVIAASMKDLPIDGNAGALLGINVSSGNGAGNRGFNRPISSNEQYNNPETVDKECETKKRGDFCFSNLTKDNLVVSLNANGTALVLSPGQTQCLYNIASGSYNFYVMGDRDFGKGGVRIYGVSQTFIHDQGQFLVEKCKSKTFTIK